MSNSYQKEFKEAIKLYEETLEKLNICKESCSKFESNIHPMSPTLYFQLCGVRGFQELNGNDYPTYITGWNERFNSAKKAKESINHTNVTNDDYMYTLATV